MSFDAALDVSVGHDKHLLQGAPEPRERFRTSHVFHCPLHFFHATPIFQLERSACTWN